MAETIVSARDMVTRFDTDSLCLCRTTFQRLSDAKLFHGWIESVDSKGFSVRLTTEGEPNMGDRFGFTAYSVNGTAIFMATLETVARLNSFALDANAAILLFRFDTEVKVGPGDENARTATPGLQGVVLNERFEVIDDSIEIVDISIRGLAFKSWDGHERGKSLWVQVETPHGTIRVLGTVRYSRVWQGTHRTGLLVEEIGRLDRPRWNRLLERR